MSVDRTGDFIPLVRQRLQDRAFRLLKADERLLFGRAIRALSGSGQAPLAHNGANAVRVSSPKHAPPISADIGVPFVLRWPKSDCKPLLAPERSYTKKLELVIMHNAVERD